MPGSDTKTGNSSRATQAVVTGSRHHLSPMSLRYLQWTHQPRLSGSLTLIGTLKKDMTCPGNIPTSSRTFFPAYSTTMNILCLLTSRLWTPAVIPRTPVVCGAPGCRARGRRGWSTFLCRLALRPLLSWLLFIIIPPVTWPSCYITHRRSPISTHSTFLKPVKSGRILLLAGVSVWGPGWLGSSCFLCCRR